MEIATSDWLASCHQEVMNELPLLGAPREILTRRRLKTLHSCCRAFCDFSQWEHVADLQARKWQELVTGIDSTDWGIQYYLLRSDLGHTVPCMPWVPKPFLGGQDRNLMVSKWPKASWIVVKMQKGTRIPSPCHCILTDRHSTRHTQIVKHNLCPGHQRIIIFNNQGLKNKT